MNRKEKEQFLKENYEILEEGKCADATFVDRNGITIKGSYRIYKAKVLQRIPKDMIEHCRRFANTPLHWCPRRDWYGLNGDYGYFDSIAAVRNVGTKKEGYTIECYISAILRRPFTEEQRKHYESLFYPCSTRCLRIYDSANDK
jgi:hypothetical protein